jgi:serine/threonine protein phosphatase PrpC
MTPDDQVSPTMPMPSSSDGIAPSRLRVDVAGRSEKGTRARNEDAFVIYRLGRFMECVGTSLPEDHLPQHVNEGSHLLIVGDGIGGAAGGDLASRTAMMTLVESILRSPKWALKLDDPATRETEIEELMTRSRAYMQGMHAAIRERQQRDPEYRGMGTTFTSAYCVGNDMFIMHVGDTRAYSLRNGRIFRITHDHTIAQAYADIGRIDPSEVDRHPLNHVLTRAVGGPDDTLAPDMHHRDIEDGDRLVLCSDGLTKVVNEAEIAAILAAHPTSAAASAALVELALERGAPDNVTLVVAGFRVE